MNRVLEKNISHWCTHFVNILNEIFSLKIEDFNLRKDFIDTIEKLVARKYD